MKRHVHPAKKGETQGKQASALRMQGPDFDEGAFPVGAGLDRHARQNTERELLGAQSSRRPQREEGNAFGEKSEIGFRL